MNDERLNQYQNQANLDQAAKEFIEKDNQYTQDIDNLRNQESDLTQEYDSLTGELKGIDDPQKDQAKYHDLRNQSQQVFDERQGVTQSLKAKEAEHETFKKEYEAKAQQVGGQGISKDQSPGNTERQYTPDPRDAGKQDKPGQDKTVQDVGETLQNSGVEADKQPENDNRLNQWQQQANDQENQQVHENTLGNDSVAGGMQQDEPER